VTSIYTFSQTLSLKIEQLFAVITWDKMIPDGVKFVWIVLWRREQWQVIICAKKTKCDHISFSLATRVGGA